MTDEIERLKKTATFMAKGNLYEDFEIGQTFEHHWGRTLNEADNSAFTTLTLNYNPLYFNVEFAKAHGHKGILVHPLLVFNTVFGLSVEDLSEAGGPFVGVDELTHHLPVYPGDTLTARSTTTHMRPSKSKPAIGLVTWHTEGFNQDEARVIDFRRTNIVRKRNP